MKFIKRLWNKIRYRELYRELKEAEKELAEFQALLQRHRVKLKADFEVAQTIRNIQQEKK
jgi:hypothetical protein